MEALHARYPFLDAAREAVEAADVDLATVVAEEPPVVERALDRIRSAIEEGDVGAPRRSHRIELLSYPIARVLVSLVDEPGLVHRYARAEAATAFERLQAESGEASQLKSVSHEALDREDLQREFDLADAVERIGDGSNAGGAWVDVTVYLDLTSELDGQAWSLPGRLLADGRVRVSETEFDRLLREAIRSRVAADLPLDVPDPIADELDEAVAAVRSLLADVDRSWDVDAVEPDLFPPCVDALLKRVEGGEDLPAHSRFALTSFLAATGMSTGAIADRVATDAVTEAEGAEQVAHLRDEDGVEYPAPSCASMQAYGDCVNRDALCSRIAHPMTYYERRLRGDDPADYADRRESQ